MRRSVLVLLTALAGLCGCGSGATIGQPRFQSSTAPSPRASSTASPSPRVSGATPTATPTATPAVTGSPTATPTPSPVPTPTVAGVKLYVVNHSAFGPNANGNPSVTVYPTGASGNATPIATLAGNLTGEQQNYFTAVGPDGHVYLPDQQTTQSSGVLRTYANATGNQSPLDTISGLYQPLGVDLDTSGNVYVGLDGAIDVFAPGATGAAMPVRSIAGSGTAISGQSVYQVFVEPSGKIDAAVQNEIVSFAPGATGDATPTQAIFGEATTIVTTLGVAADASGNLWATDNSTNRILEFSSTATGDTAPTAIVTGTAFDQPFGIFFDSAGTAYVANRGNNSILIFASGTLSTGVPSATISGANTGLDNPTGVYVR